MIADEGLLYEFENGLNPQRLKDSTIPAAIIGYGEISAIFQIADHPAVAFKRLPLFYNRSAAEKYTRQYHEYCHLLSESGLHLPEHQTFIIEPPDRPVAVYIAQRMLLPESFGHRLLQVFELDDIRLLIEMIVTEISKIWHFNRAHYPGVELAIDGQFRQRSGLHPHAAGKKRRAGRYGPVASGFGACNRRDPGA